MLDGIQKGSKRPCRQPHNVCRGSNRATIASMWIHKCAQHLYLEGVCFRGAVRCSGGLFLHLPQLGLEGRLGLLLLPLQLLGTILQRTLRARVTL